MKRSILAAALTVPLLAASTLSHAADSSIDQYKPAELDITSTGIDDTTNPDGLMTPASSENNDDTTTSDIEDTNNPDGVMTPVSSE